MSDFLEFRANVRASAFTGLVESVGKNGWSIDIEDEASGVHIMTLTMTFEQFGAILGTRPRDGVIVRMTPPSILAKRIGMRHDSRTIIVDLPPGFDWMKNSPGDLVNAPQVVAMTNAGWGVADLDEEKRHNMHRDVPARRSPRGVEGYKVRFWRYVDPDDPPAEPSEEMLPEKKGRGR